MNTFNQWVKECGGCSDAARVIERTGYVCSQPKIYHVYSGNRPPSAELALQIEISTRGKVQASDLMEDALTFWRKKRGMRRYRSKA